MNMYNALVNIVLIWLQSYDIFSNVVSFAYGKDVKEKKSETAINQRIKKNAHYTLWKIFGRGMEKVIKRTVFDRGIP